MKNKIKSKKFFFFIIFLLANFPGIGYLPIVNHFDCTGLPNNCTGTELVIKLNPILWFPEILSKWTSVFPGNLFGINVQEFGHFTRPFMLFPILSFINYGEIITIMLLTLYWILLSNIFQIILKKFKRS